MERLASLPNERLRGVRAVLTDVDGTLTTGARVTPSTYAAVQALHDAGLIVIPITGGPAGMCMTMARMWPVNAVVGESGAFYFRHLIAERKMLKRYWFDDATRSGNTKRIAAARDEILAKVPKAGLAADQNYRDMDLAIDWAEDREPLSTSDVDTIKSIMKAHGLHAHQSSIHVNGWIGDYGKLSMTRILLKEQFNIDMDADRDSMIYVGDAPNDAQMFDFFPLSVGVANIRHYGDAVKPLPSYVTEQSFGAGFEEVARAILAAKASSP